MTMASRIGVMNAGRIEQVAAPRALYETPRSRWIAQFVGDINLFEARLESRDDHRLTVSTRDAGTLLIAPPRDPVGSSAFSVAIRPEKVKLSPDGLAGGAANGSGFNRLQGVVTEICYLGGSTTYRVKLDSGAIVQSAMANTARAEADAFAPNQRVVAWFRPDDCLVLAQ